MSLPKGASINDSIVKDLATLSYITIQDVAKDIFYRQKLMHPEDQQLFGMSFLGSDYTDAAQECDQCCCSQVSLLL